MDSTEKVTNSATKLENGTGKITKYRWLIMVVIFCLYTIANADRANIGVALPFIRKDIQMSNTEAGALASLFFAGYSLAMIPAGFFVGKFGVRKPPSVFMFLTSIFTGALAMVSSPLALKLCRFFTGVAESPVNIGMVTTINNWFPAKEKGTATGIYVAAAKFGPLIVPIVCGAIIQAYGWREVFIAFAVPGMILSIIWYFVVRNQPKEGKFCSKAEVDYIKSDVVAVQETKKPKREYKLYWLDKLVRARKVQRLDTTAKIFKSWDIIGAAFCYFFMVGIISVMMSWIPTYLTSVRHLAVMKMAFVASAPFAGTVIGNVIGGYISDNFLNKRRKPLMIVTAASTACMMYSFVYAPASPNLLAALLFITGLLLSLGYSAYMVYPMGLASKEKYPIAVSVINCVGQFGGFVTPLVVGMILDKYNWDMVFAVLSGGSIISLLLLFTIIDPVEDPLVK